MMFNKVVAQFKDRTIMKGRTFNFSQNREIFHLHRLDGATVDIALEELKAVFFVKDYRGDKNHHYLYSDIVEGGGTKIEIKFYDGEHVKGFMHTYHHGREGFFITPADINGNNIRIFVVTSAAEEIVHTHEAAPAPVTEPSFAF
jgi:hypothetical protein